MARTVQTRFKSALPGSGFDSSGSARQGKRRVVGQISVTSYTSVGESLTAADLGLSTIDYIAIRHNDQAGGKEGSEARFVEYNNSTSDFYIVQAGKPATAGSHTLQFEAFGDALDAPELT